ncbi:MAG: ABC transporter permease subunit [Acidobacteriota bacterium]
MKGLIINKTILNNIYDFKFLISSLIVILLLILGTSMSISNISLQSKEYNRFQSLAENEKNLENVKVIKRPNKFIFAHEGGERNLPQYLIVLPYFVDYPIEDLSLKPFIENLQNLDWSFVVGYLFSLIAFLVTYDLVSGEKEKGTLRLLVSQPISKDSFLFGGFLGALLSLIPFLLIGLIISIIIILFNANISFDENDWIKIFFVIILSFFFISSMVLIGIFTSTVSTKSSTSLIISLIIWVFIAIIIPNGGVLVSEIISPIPSFKEFEIELRGAEKIFYSKITLSSIMLREIYTRRDLSNAEKRNKVDQLQKKIYRENRQALEEYKQDILKIRKNYLKKLENQMRLAKISSKLSPLSVYMNSIEGIVRTGYAHQLTFFRIAEQYMREYTIYANKMQEELKDKAKIMGPKIVDEGYEVEGISWISYKDINFDKSSFPKFPEYNLTISNTFPIALIDIGILIFFNILFFVLSYVKFLSYDVR